MPPDRVSPLTAAVKDNYDIIPAVQVQFNHRRVEHDGAKVGWFVTTKFYGDGRSRSAQFGYGLVDRLQKYLDEPLTLLGRIRPWEADPIKTFKLLADALVSGPKGYATAAVPAAGAK